MSNDKLWREKIIDVLTLLISAGVIYLFVVTLSDKFFYKDTPDDSDLINEEIIIPDEETPPDEDEDIIPEKEVYTLKVINPNKKDQAYIPSSNPYGSSYKSEAKRLTIIGEFDSILIKASGEVYGEGYRFLSFNIGNESGIYKAVRNGENSLDIEKTKENGGAFNEDNPINLQIDLLVDTEIGTTRKDYETNKEGTKTVKFWDKIKPPTPTVTYMLIAPFSQYGGYGQAAITDISIEYICKDGYNCSITLCSNSSKTTQCLIDATHGGLEVARQWCENAEPKVDCSGLPKAKEE